MSVRRLSLLFLVALFAMAQSTMATTLMQMNLLQISGNAEKIFKGTVLDITEGTVSAGGASLPTVTYRVSVDEPLKGDFPLIKEQRITEIRMLGKARPLQSGNASLVPVLPDMPELEIGRSYVLFTTAPSAIGLSTTVGLGQGCFHLSMKEGEETAVNEFGNRGLFAGLTLTESAGRPTDGPVSYSELVRHIRATLGAN